MLISQKVAKNPNFLTSLVKKPLVSTFDLRIQILHAAKFVVPNEMLNLGHFHDDALCRVVGKDFADLTEEDMSSRREIYHLYGKLPYKLIMIENETGALLVEKKSVDGKVNKLGESHLETYDTVITHIDKEGAVSPLRIAINTDASSLTNNSDKLIPSSFGLYCTDAEFDKYMELIYRQCARKGGDPMTRSLGLFKYMAQLFSAMTFETLLFLNAKNTTIVTYQPSRKELANLPKNLLSNYEYKILDVFRTVKEFKSLNDVLHFASKEESEIQLRRAHFVRGHFKRRNGKLFWWNPFMRNRKNAGEVGFVDKDYNLVDSK
jgi:hypothetical protein